jgi:hypothetical protein
VQPAEINLNCPRRLFEHKKISTGCTSSRPQKQKSFRISLFRKKEKLKLPKLLPISNLLLHDKRVRASAPKNELKKGQNAWSALRAAKEKARQRRTSSILVPLFYQIRTYFQNKH